MTSSTSSGASSMVGRPGMKASATPATTKRIDGAVLIRCATTATTTPIARRRSSVWMVAVIAACGWEPMSLGGTDLDQDTGDVAHASDRVEAARARRRERVHIDAGHRLRD